MARLWVRRIVCCLAILAILPGCQFLQNSARSPEAEARPLSESAKELPNGPNPYQKYFNSPESDASNLGIETNKRTASSAPDFSSPRETSGSNLKSLIEPSPPQLGLQSSSSEYIKPSVVRVPALAPSSDLGEGKMKVTGPNFLTVQANAPPALVQQPANLEKKPIEYAPLVRALQCILEDRNQEAIQHLQAYDRDTQEFFLQLLPALTILVKTPIDKLTPPQIAVLNGQLESIQQRLRPRSELVVSKMRYCRRIHTFASYEELPDNHAFLAGSKDRPGEDVLLYIELKNFASEPTPEGDFLTKLLVTLELKNAQGKVVWMYSYPRPETTHRRKARLNDFCSGYSFPMPDITPGAYQLWIQVIDESIPEIRRIARKSLDFRVTPVSEPGTSR